MLKPISGMLIFLATFENAKQTSAITQRIIVGHFQSVKTAHLQLCVLCVLGLLCVCADWPFSDERERER